MEVARHVVDHIDDRACQLLGALASFRPMPAHDDRNFVMRHFSFQKRDLGVRVEAEMIDRDDARKPEMVADVGDVALQIGDPFGQRIEVFRIEFLEVRAAVIL
jgi:hypothetical protein